MAALPAVIKRDVDRLAYRVYVTDVLRGLFEGTSPRYIDWIDQKPQDTRTGDDIDRELSEKFGWEVN